MIEYVGPVTLDPVWVDQDNEKRVMHYIAEAERAVAAHQEHIASLYAEIRNWQMQLATIRRRLQDHQEP